jgi:hypothetical protein
VLTAALLATVLAPLAAALAAAALLAALTPGLLILLTRLVLAALATLLAALLSALVWVLVRHWGILLSREHSRFESTDERSLGSGQRAAAAECPTAHDQWPIRISEMAGI